MLPRAQFARRLSASKMSVEWLVRRYARLAQRVVAADIGRVASDPDDDAVLACALAAGADLIVSGDAHLFNLKTYHGIPIVNAAEALTRLVQR